MREIRGIVTGTNAPEGVNLEPAETNFRTENGFIRTDPGFVEHTLRNSIRDGGLSFGQEGRGYGIALLNRVIELSAVAGFMYVGPVRYRKRGNWDGDIQDEELRSQVVNPAYELHAEFSPRPDQKIRIEAHGYTDISQMPVVTKHPRALWNWPNLKIYVHPQGYKHDDRPPSYLFEFSRGGVNRFETVNNPRRTLSAPEAMDFLADNLPPEITHYDNAWMGLRQLTDTADRAVETLQMRSMFGLTGADVELTNAWLQNARGKDGHGGVLFVPPTYFDRRSRPGSFVSTRQHEADFPDDIIEQANPHDRVTTIVAGLGINPDDPVVENTILLLRGLPHGSGEIAFSLNLGESPNSLQIPRTRYVPTIFFDRAAQWLLEHPDVTNTATDYYREMYKTITGHVLEFPDDYWTDTMIINAMCAGFSHVDATEGKKIFEEELGRERKKRSVDLKSEDNQQLITQAFVALAAIGRKLENAGIYER